MLIISLKKSRNFNLIISSIVLGLGGGTGLVDDTRYHHEVPYYPPYPLQNNLTLIFDLAHGGFGIWSTAGYVDLQNNIADGHFNHSAFSYWFTYSRYLFTCYLNL